MIKAFYSGLLKTKSGWKKRLKLVCRVLVSVGILAFLLKWLSTEKLLSAFMTIPASVWGIVFCGFIAGHLLSALKWRLLLHAVGVRITFLEAIRAHGAGLFANLCLPSIIGGDFVRAGVIIRGRGRIEAIALGSLADRINDSFALVAIAGLAGMLVPNLTNMEVGKILSGIAIFLLVMVIAGFLVIRWIPMTRLPDRPAAIIFRFRTALLTLTASPLIAISTLILSIAIQSGFIGLNVLLANAMGMTAPLLLWFFAWPLAKLIAMVPVSLGGIGVREAAFAALLAPFGVPTALAVAQALSWEIVLIVSGLFAGLTVTLLPGYTEAGHLKLKGEDV